MAAPRISMTKRLGVRAGQSVVLLGAPVRLAARIEAELAALDEAIRVARQLRPAPVDCAVLFVASLPELEHRISKVYERLHPEGQLWIAWRPRRALDVDEEVVRRIGLTAGMALTRVEPLARGWSGMRLVIRRQNRDALAYRLLGRPRRTRRATPPPPLLASGGGSALASVRARRRS
jgi:hypothetical protein